MQSSATFSWEWTRAILAFVLKLDTMTELNNNNNAIKLVWVPSQSLEFLETKKKKKRIKSH